MYFIGIDLGSSSVKVSLVDKDTGEQRAFAREPVDEMEITSVAPGWAEQDPGLWWQYLCTAIKKILVQSDIPPHSVAGVGISYQMHGLVLVDASGHTLRPAIIWCDGRAAAIGDKAVRDLGTRWCTGYLLNSPANFTASKLKWVAENETDIFNRIHKILLPGDFIAYQLTGEMATTVPGLTEGIFWDFQQDALSEKLLEYYGFSTDLIPDTIDTFSRQGTLHKEAAEATGLVPGTPVLYRAGDQPNNALALNVFQPGEIAATAGTSGVFYAVTDSLKTQLDSGVNNFAHVNHSAEHIRIGKLLCINGAGIQYRWLLNNLAVNSYEEMNKLAGQAPVGSDGLKIYPFGNGPERMLGHRQAGGEIAGIHFNRHNKTHICRAALEGIAFSFAYGMELLEAEGIRPKKIRAGNDNMFRSDIFSQTVVNCIQQEIEIFNTTGATGAARACALTDGDFSRYGEMVRKLDFEKRITPNPYEENYREAYQSWKNKLEKIL